MLLPMFGFLAALLTVGGLATLVAVGDPRSARLAPYIGFVALLSGLEALSFALLLTLIGWMVLHSEHVAGLGFVAGYVLGGLGGAALGLYCAIQRRHRNEHSEFINNGNNHYQETL
jgi:hypothetical protein